jgi:uncharacterized protein YbjT (DUF2867 family)
MSTPLGITGSTGRVGGLVATALADARRELRLIVRDPSRAPAYEHADVWEASYRDEAASVGALDGVDVLFMVSAAENKDRVSEHFTFVDAAEKAGVRHIVYTSFYGASPDSVFTLGRDHFATEERIRQSGMSYTFLRDNLYANFLPMMTGEDGVLRGPAGHGRLSAVAQEDVAAVATAVLLDPGEHQDETYHLTGPEAFTLSEAAETITRVTGRAVSYHDETVEEAYASRASYGAEDWQVDAWVSTYTAIAAGEMDGVSPDVERLVGRTPYSLEDLLRGVP